MDVRQINILYLEVGKILIQIHTLYNDENRIYHIICKDTEENRNLLREYKEKLKERFQQKEIMMYYINVNRF